MPSQYQGMNHVAKQSTLVIRVCRMAAIQFTCQITMWADIGTIRLCRVEETRATMRRNLVHSGGEFEESIAFGFQSIYPIVSFDRSIQILLIRFLILWNHARSFQSTMSKVPVNLAISKGAGVLHNQAIVANGMVFCSGQLPADLESGELVAGDIKQNTVSLGFSNPNVTFSFQPEAYWDIIGKMHWELESCSWGCWIKPWECGQGQHFSRRY